MVKLTNKEFDALTSAVCLAEAHWEDDGTGARTKALNSAYEKIKAEFYAKIASPTGEVNAPTATTARRGGGGGTQ